MRTKKLIFSLALTALLTGCKKQESPINKALDRGYLNNTWIVNDENAEQESQTNNSQAFAKKTKPCFTFMKDNTYFFFYRGEDKKQVRETGVWNINGDQLELKGNPVYSSSFVKVIVGNDSTKTLLKVVTDSSKTFSVDYIFKINDLTEEVLTLTHVFEKTVRGVGQESSGNTTTETRSTNEILYFEDHD